MKLKMTQFNLQLPEDVHSKLKGDAFYKGITMQEYILSLVSPQVGKIKVPKTPSEAPDSPEPKEKPKVDTIPNSMEFCKKHPNSRKSTCGCK